MNGLALSRAYYETLGRPMLERCFPKHADRIATGLVGHGSECFGFDDALSTDHDYGPAFCMWLTNEDFSDIGESLAREYAKLPRDFLGFNPRNATPEGGRRVGVMRTHDFYSGFLGRSDIPSKPLEWFYLPESRLACATNGSVFDDKLGAFTHVRTGFLGFYPEDVRLKKMASRLFAMGQSGQYNYARCMQRGEYVAAQHALSCFSENCISFVYLMNRRYKPFYKWMHRGMSTLPKLPAVAALLNKIARAGLPVEAWQNTEYLPHHALNSADANVLVIEQICRLVKETLQQEGLTDSDNGFLPAHQTQINARIQNNVIRDMPLLEG